MFRSTVFARARTSQQLNQRNEANYNWQLLSRAKKSHSLLPLCLSLPIHALRVQETCIEKEFLVFAVGTRRSVLSNCRPIGHKNITRENCHCENRKKYINIKSNFQCNINCTQCTYARVRLCPVCMDHILSGILVIFFFGYWQRTFWSSQAKNAVCMTSWSCGRARNATMSSIASGAVCEYKIGRINWKMTSIYKIWIPIAITITLNVQTQSERTEENGIK